MAVIAFINYNVSIACVWGSMSVLFGAVEARLGIGREFSSMAAPAVNLSTALCAPVAGVLAARYSLKAIMLVGSLCSVAGFALLALTASYPLYLLAFGLLLGPGMAVGAILPGTLVTRWFAANRGKALGVVNMPILIGLVPLASAWMLQSHGLPATYAALAALAAVSVVSNLFIIDHPPAAAVTAAVDVHDEPVPAGARGMNMAQLLRLPRFWGVTLAFIASATASVILGAHMVPMVRSWGMSATAGATLLSVYFFAGIAGTITFGWIADRLGGILALALLVSDTAMLWMLLLLHPPFAAAALLAGLIGMHSAAAVPVISLALSEAFGRESFSRAYGLVNLVILPFSVLCVPATALVYTNTRSYAGAIIMMSVFLALTGLAALSAWRRPAKVLVEAC
jgi:MFS family permease